MPRAPAGGSPARCAVVLGCNAVAIARPDQIALNLTSYRYASDCFAFCTRVCRARGVGAKFPHELAAPDQSGEQQTLKSLMGEKGVAIFFVRSADWCPFCKGQQPAEQAEIERLQRGIVKLKTEKDIKKSRGLATECPILKALGAESIQ